MRMKHARRISSLLAAFAVGAGIVYFATATCAIAQTDPFGEGWVLDRAASRLTFQSVKNQSVVETSSFASFQGRIDAQGRAQLSIQLDSVDTGIDLRNVRMRFLFFETFKHPEAVITAQIDREAIARLAEARRMEFPLDYELDLHGLNRR